MSPTESYPKVNNTENILQSSGPRSVSLVVVSTRARMSHYCPAAKVRSGRTQCSPPAPADRTPQTSRTLTGILPWQNWRKLEFDFHSSSQIISPVGSAAVLAVESEIASVEDWPGGSWRFLTPRQLDESLVRVSDLLQSSTERHHKHGRICWRQIWFDFSCTEK